MSDVEVIKALVEVQERTGLCDSRFAAVINVSPSTWRIAKVLREIPGRMAPRRAFLRGAQLNGHAQTIADLRLVA